MKPMSRQEALEWLKETNEETLKLLWARADETRRNIVGDAVHLRGLIEMSNYCVRRCHYCGLRIDNRHLTRYRMTHAEVLNSVRDAVRFGYGTVVLQAGEDPELTQERVAALIQAIKQETSLAVTLSLGERDVDELAAWRRAGADRYLLRFETSNMLLYDRIHPPRDGRKPCDRFALLRELKRLDYEVGSGVMVGLPGQNDDDLVTDLELFQTHGFDMIGIGPFIAHPETPLGQTPTASKSASTSDLELMTYKMIALTRIYCPQANIPATTALATLNLAEGREQGLCRGANVLMPNLTPAQYRLHYEIYPAKACIRETARQCHGCMRRRIAAIGRQVGDGPGSAHSYSFPSHPAAAVER